MRIQNGILMPIESEIIQNGFVDFEDGKITAFGAMKDAPAYSGEVFDAQGGYILPGLIDAHTHIGISEEGLRWEGADYNEGNNAVTPEMRAEDGFNPFDAAVSKAANAGVTCAAVAPGSANVIGGSIAAIKLFGTDVSDMILKAPCAFKFALGENPKSHYGRSLGKEPETRMAVAAIMRRTLNKTLHYMAKKEKDPDTYDPTLEPLIPVLKREIPVHFHAHRADDILTAVRIAKEFNLRFHIVHATNSFRIIPQMVKETVIPMIGPSLGPASKPETMGGGFHTCGMLHEAGMEVAITTDHDVTPLWMLPFFAAMCVREGLPEDAAFRAITINPAKAMGVDERVGSIKVGKDADIAVFNGHPFHYMTTTSAVFIDGKRIK